MNINIFDKIRWALVPKNKELAYINARVDGLNLPKNIIPMQKSVPPYMPVQSGHGYMGVLLYNTEDDIVQCHICGAWRNSLGQHLGAHKIKSREYKDKFGLYRSQPLNGLRTRADYHRIAVTRNKRLKKNLSPMGRQKGMEKCNAARAKRGAKSIQFQNQYGTCEAQLRNRVKQHVEKFGFFPRSTSKEDPNLATMLWRRFGSIGAAKDYYGYK